MYRALSEEEKCTQFWPEPNKRSQDESKLANFMKTKSLRDKFRDSKTWTIRRSAEKEITSPTQSSTTFAGNSFAADASPALSNSEGRLSRLFSLRRSLGPSGPSSLDSPCQQQQSSPQLLLSSKTSMPRLAEEEEQMLLGSAPPLKRGGIPPPPTLPVLGSQKAAGLTQEQTKRRHIISSLVHSENNYVATLQRLVNDYKRVLEESSPPILSASKVQILFHKVPEILQCHLMFRIALSDAIKNWDNDEKIGDVFVASFSKAVVLEIYSDFINNFSMAMDCAKQESKRKSALADFLKVKQITAHDRVSFFGLMVKPVQRFPQFILLLQDLLKETPPGHADRMALQLALTTLESLAEMLNERKREAEQFAAFRDKMRNISGKLSASRAMQHHNTESGGCRFLLKEDDVTQLEFNSAGHISRSKQRRLLLLNDLLLCVTVNGRPSDVDFNALNANNERLSLKWAVPVGEVELIDGTAGGTLARLLAPAAAANTVLGKRASLGRTSNPVGVLEQHQHLHQQISVNNSHSSAGGQAENLAQDMADLMHDFDVVSRIASLIGTMRSSYEGLNTEVTSHILGEIQRSIRQKDEEMSFMDACCLQLAIKGGKGKQETYTFQTRDPNVKKEWIVELRLAQLALDPNNSPGWDVLEQERSISTKMPLYVKSFQVFHESFHTEINCGCSYSLMIQTPTRTLRKQTYVWTNATRSGSAAVAAAGDSNTGHLRIFGVTNHHTGLKELGTVAVPDYQVRTIQFVPGLRGGIASSSTEDALKSDLVWVGTDCQKIILYLASDPDRGIEVSRTTLPSQISSLQYHCDAVWIGLASGSLAVIRRDVSGSWELGAPQTILLGSEPVSCLLPIPNGGLYAACGKRVWVVDAFTNEQVKSFTVQPRQDGGVQVSSSTTASTTNLSSLASPGSVHQMAQSGVGLWVALKNSSTICLYHTETFRHLQDINIASNVSRVLAARDVTQPQRSIHVTALLASRGLLWVGTNVGIALTVPLPRLEGVPIISGRANISYHAHFGPVTFFLNLQPRVVTEVLQQQHPSPQQFFSSSSIREESEQDLKLSDGNLNQSSAAAQDKSGLKKQLSDGSIRGEEHLLLPKLRHRNSSPQMNRRNNGSRVGNRVDLRRASKTLPRGFSINQQTDMSSMDCDVFGLYGELLNVRDYDCDSGEFGGAGGGGRLQGEELRKSDPELSTIPYRVSTLDRRVKMKTSRPRSLDMSSWSMESRGSAQTTTSSSSEAGSERPSPNVSRNASFQSTTDSSSSSGGIAVTATAAAAPAAAPAAATVTTPVHESSNNSVQSEKVRKKLDAPRTVTTLMGGRGYINWRRTSVEKHRTSSAQINNCDAFLVIWEMKL